MKKTLTLFLFLLAGYAINAQDFGIGISGGYLTELEGGGGSLDLIYEFDDHWGGSATTTFAMAEEAPIRNKWFMVDLNGRYKVIDELYLLAGGEYISLTVKNTGLGGGSIQGESEVTETDFGINLGSGYKYNIMDNVNVFAEVKYVIIEQGYLHARLGILFDL
ncbi:MAG: hypothetical protein CL596_07755 [Alteromonas sp.]|nr:hypothetical protein [Alteromonas sp.]MAY22183.1 hypothetical protein [Flavobacteriaceae bacterium]|tara:strand:+ start:66176 stop:66664 length:489 start_codon:yes stop_codon:yes gene_type:complete